MTTPRRRYKKLNIKTISFCPRGKNTLPVLYKDQGMVEMSALAKATPDGELLCVVAAPGVVDTEGDFTNDPAVIKTALYEAARTGVKFDIYHDGKPVGVDRAYEAERFIIQKGDPRFANFRDYGGTPRDVTGGYGAVIKLLDPELKKLYEVEKWNGVSLYGNAEMELLSKAELEEMEPMALSKEDLEAVGTVVAKAFVTAMGELKKAEAVAPPKAEAPVVPAAPVVFDPAVFKGDPANIKQVEAHLAKVQAEEIRKAVNWSDPASVATYVTVLKAQAPPPAPAATQQPLAPAGVGTNGQLLYGLQKAESDLAKAGAETAAALNKSFGMK